MTLSEYLVGKKGIKILSTADSAGMVGTAVYSMPKIMDDGTLAFIMRERLAYENLKSNPHAAFMFIEEGGGYNGIRLFLTKTGEDDNPELIASMTRRHLTPEEDKKKGPKHIVYFKIDKILPLVGDSETGITI